VTTCWRRSAIPSTPGGTPAWAPESDVLKALAEVIIASEVIQVGLESEDAEEPYQ
jgi:hypothetical protein